MSDRERKRVPDHRSDVLKGSLPQGLSAHPRNTEDPRLSEESEKESRDEATQIPGGGWRRGGGGGGRYGEGAGWRGVWGGGLYVNSTLSPPAI